MLPMLVAEPSRGKLPTISYVRSRLLQADTRPVAPRGESEKQQTVDAAQARDDAQNQSNGLEHYANREHGDNRSRNVALRTVPVVICNGEVEDSQRTP